MAHDRGQIRKRTNEAPSRRSRAGSASRASAPTGSESRKARQLDAEMNYADSMVRQAFGDQAGMVAALERSLDALPTYAPAILSVGSIEYQRKRVARGRRLFLSLLDLPDETVDLQEIIDEAGEFLISLRAYDDGLELYRRAVTRFPNVVAYHLGISCCAGPVGHRDEAIAAAQAALALEPDNQGVVNDLGWSLFEAGRFGEAREVLERAVAMDPADKLAAKNLRRCREAIEKCGGGA